MEKLEILFLLLNIFTLIIPYNLILAKRYYESIIIFISILLSIITNIGILIENSQKLISTKFFKIIKYFEKTIANIIIFYELHLFHINPINPIKNIILFVCNLMTIYKLRSLSNSRLNLMLVIIRHILTYLFISDFT